jgi:hypothetical protein
MKHLIEIAGITLLLDPDALAAVYKILDTGEQIEQTYKGDGKGNRGSSMQYIDEIKPVDPRGWLKTTVMSQDYYDTLKLVNNLNP